MDKDPSIDVEIDDDFKGIAVIGCPQCDTTTRHPLDSLSAGSVIECSCGFSIQIEGDGFTAAQREFKDLKRLLDDF